MGIMDRYVYIVDEPPPPLLSNPMEIDTRIFRGGGITWLGLLPPLKFWKKNFVSCGERRWRSSTWLYDLGWGKWLYKPIISFSEFPSCRLLWFSGHLMNYCYLFLKKKRRQNRTWLIWVRSPDFLVVSDSERRRVPESVVGEEQGKAVYAMYDEHDQWVLDGPLVVDESY